MVTGIAPYMFIGQVQPVAAAAGAVSEVKVTGITLTGGAGANGTPEVKMHIQITGLKPGDYAIYLGDTKRATGASVNPGTTEWITGTDKKMFTAEELGKGLDLTTWTAKGPKYITIATVEGDKAVAPSAKIIVK
ncbi:MAG: hypothetical protein WCV91_01285 [Candidatus Margulisiibacteriota bacterium]